MGTGLGLVIKQGVGSGRGKRRAWRRKSGALPWRRCGLHAQATHKCNSGRWQQAMRGQNCCCRPEGAPAERSKGEHTEGVGGGQGCLKPTGRASKRSAVDTGGREGRRARRGRCDGPCGRSAGIQSLRCGLVGASGIQDRRWEALEAGARWDLRGAPAGGAAGLCITGAVMGELHIVCLVWGGLAGAQKAASDFRSLKSPKSRWMTAAAPCEAP
jgi:hypothetical protein